MSITIKGPDYEETPIPGVNEGYKDVDSIYNSSLGVTLHVGDVVIFTARGYGYLQKGVVVSLQQEVRSHFPNNPSKAYTVSKISVKPYTDEETKTLQKRSNQPVTKYNRKYTYGDPNNFYPIGREEEDEA